MKLGTRSRIALATAVLTTGALLGPSAPAAAFGGACVPDHCDSVIRYYSDATYTQQVGEYAGAVCGEYEWGYTTQYVRRYFRTC